MFKPRTFAAKDLRPLEQLVPGDAPGEWTSTGTAPVFLLASQLSPGAIKLRLRLWSDQPGSVRLGLVRDEGIPPADWIDLGWVHGKLDVERYIPLDRPATGLRLQVLDRPGAIQMRVFELEHLSEWEVFTRAIPAKLKAAYQSGSLAALGKRALKALLKRDPDAFRRKCLHGLSAPTAIPQNVAYQMWRQKHELTDLDRQRLQREIAALAHPPLISLVLPVDAQCDAAALARVAATVHSVQAQAYPHWELSLAAQGEQSDDLLVKLSQVSGGAAESPAGETAPQGTVKLVRGTSARALQLAEGSHFGLLQPGDLLAEHALFEFASLLTSHPETDLVYSDEDTIDDIGNHSKPFFKPDWSPEYLLACPYIQNLSLFRCSTVLEMGGLRPECSGAAIYDLALRLSTRSSAIRHIPDVLYHRLEIDPHAVAEQAVMPRDTDAVLCALQDHVRTTHRNARVEPGPVAGVNRVRFSLAGQPLISIVIPTACGKGQCGDIHTWYMLQCVKSIYAKTTYPNFEIVALNNNDMPDELVEALRPYPVRHVTFDEPFNLSNKINLGAERAKGEHLVLLNDDIEIISPDWLESMLEFSQQPEIGAVGVKLLFPDNRLQHVGVTILAARPGHAFYGFPRKYPGYFLGNLAHRNYSAVTGACLMTPTALYRRLGGFDPRFPMNYNDVDYCLRVQKANQRVVFTPYAELYHHESVTKSGVGEDELEVLRQKWGSDLQRDPFYNPNLSMRMEDYSIDASFAA